MLGIHLYLSVHCGPGQTSLKIQKVWGNSSSYWQNSVMICLRLFITLQFWLNHIHGWKEAQYCTSDHCHICQTNASEMYRKPLRNSPCVKVSHYRFKMTSSVAFYRLTTGPILAKLWPNPSEMTQAVGAILGSSVYRRRHLLGVLRYLKLSWNPVKLWCYIFIDIFILVSAVQLKKRLHMLHRLLFW